uniref:Leucine zipper, putative tumor suppressor family member 3b n=1 Tax=Cyprinus carpio TaxID=7962 RepID=A0A8C2L062_CYPCA
MGSVGSGVAGEQEFAMKSVGTRTTLPRGPPLSRRRPSDRSCSAERLHAPPSTSEGSSDERGGSSTTTDRGQLTIAASRPTNRGELEGTAAGRRDAHRTGGGVSLDACGNVEKNHDGAAAVKGRDGNNGKRDSRTPPKILTVSGKLEQNNSALVRPSAFKPVVPKSFHSMQNLVAQSGAGGRSAGSGGGSDAPQSLCEQDSPDRDPSGGNDGQGGMSDSGRNSLTSLPTYTGPGMSYGPSQALGPLSASTSHINRLSSTSSSGKSCLSYQRLATIQPSPSTDDIIQDLEDRLWEKEQEVRSTSYFSKSKLFYGGMIFTSLQNISHLLRSLYFFISQSLHYICVPALLCFAQLCQKAGEISLLKQQLRESQNEVTQRAGEMVALRGQLKELKGQMKEREETMIGLKDSYTNKHRELERCEGELKRTLTEVSMLRDKLVVFEAEVLGLKRALSELSCRSDHAVCLRDISGSSSLPWAGLHSPRTPEPLPIDSFLSLQSDEAKAQRQEAGELRRQLERLQGELHLERQQRERQALTFAQERHTWQDEKERVLKYQAQLQLSYVETLQRNQALEERVESLLLTKAAFVQEKLRNIITVENTCFPPWNKKNKVTATFFSQLFFSATE